LSTSACTLVAKKRVLRKGDSLLDRGSSLSITSLELRGLEQILDNLDTGKLIFTVAKVLPFAYEILKSSTGIMTPGVTPETLDGIRKARLEKVQQKLVNGSYRFSPSRRVLIPKLKRNEERPLDVRSPMDKLVQKAAEIVLSRL